MGRPRLVSARKLVKRVRQLARLGAHPVKYRHCLRIVRDSGLATDHLAALKYVGDHLALSLSAAQRREALESHYALLPRLLRPGLKHALRGGALIWSKQVAGDLPPLSISLEPSKLAPMEGELQLRFSFKTDLCVLTFLIAPGHIFGANIATVLFIGGLQGRIASRDEIREASRANDEVSPAAMVILSVQLLAKIMQMDALIAITDAEHISRRYSKITFDYARIWREAGGVPLGPFYRLPLESPQKPLSEIPRSHRYRTRRRREAKKAIRTAIETRLRQLVTPAAPLMKVAKPVHPKSADVRSRSNPNRELTQKPLTPRLT